MTISRVALIACLACAAVAEDAAIHAPIPIRFTLAEPSFVTLVIDDADGKRVRNLVSETEFPAGENTVWWDGLAEVAGSYRPVGVYDLQDKLVEPGKYRVRGLVRKKIDLVYEFTPYNAGHPAWHSADGSGGWLADHTPPGSVLFDPGDGKENPPQMLIGSQVAEEGDGLVWTDLEGHKKRGVRWVGGGWTGANFLARDTGKNAQLGVYAYCAATWNANDPAKSELRLNALRRAGNPRDEVKKVLTWTFPRIANQDVHNWDQEKNYLGGLAAHDDLLVVSVQKANQLLFVDAKAGKILSSVAVNDPRGAAFDGEGKLLLIVGKQVQRFALPLAGEGMKLPDPESVIGETGSLEDPQQLVLAANGEIFVSDRGNSHQVKVFSADGKFVRAIGVAGAPKEGAYDPNHMNNPRGIALDGEGRLWVAEEDHAPKRISVWSGDGKVINAFYGPARYGGGGNLSADKKHFFYYDAKNGSGGGMQFELDWEKGTSKLVNIYHRYKLDDWPMVAGLGYTGPQTPIELNGRTYLTNAFNSNPTNGAGIVGLWHLRDGTTVMCAAAGHANEWPLLRGEIFKARWPGGALPDKEKARNIFFVWSDLNGDAQVQPDEVSFTKMDKSIGSVYVAPDLSLMSSYTYKLDPMHFTAQGAPVYDLNKMRLRVENVTHRFTSGGGEAFESAEWLVVTGGPMRGYKDEKLNWFYHSQWPGLHCGHEAPNRPARPGEMFATTRLLGNPVTPRGEAGPLWAINGDRGVIYLMTTDGLFVATLGHDQFSAKPWPEEKRGVLLNDVNFLGENFWPTINQTSDGGVYLSAGKNHCSLIRLDGLDSIKRLQLGETEVTAEQLTQASAFQLQRDEERIKQQGRGTLKVGLRKTAPVIDGKLDDWGKPDWAVIYKEKVNGKETTIDAALAVADGKLYAAFRTGDKNLLVNNGQALQMLFKTGGALDVMLGAGGNERLLVTLIGGKPQAVLFRDKMPGTPADKRVPFSSPSRTIFFDRVDDLSADVHFATSGGDFEFSVPLARLDLKPEAGQSIAGDVGVLRGSNGQTTQRLYWHNKATSIVSDVPSEAQLAPQLWGTFQFVDIP
jgi:hypothetical protein